MLVILLNLQNINFTNFQSFSLIDFVPFGLQIVMKYYGGRDISDEDLERALLVGMSLHERRRVEKKRGVSLKHVTASDALDNEPENNGSGPLSVLENTLNTNNVDGAHALGGETGSKNGSIMTTGMDLSLPNIYSKPEGCSETSVNDGKYLNSDDMEASETTSERKVTIYGCDTNSECKGPLNGTVSSKSNSKLSLLGHGPHGKQVVDHLLKEYGDDGILEFCQRWRKVFVDTIHPRYLPAGWDVTHRCGEPWLSMCSSFLLS